MSPAEPSSTSYAARSGRYVLAALGPIAVAGANFLVSFSMLRLASPHDFGTFTLLFATAMFTSSLANALFAAPLQALHVTGRSNGSEANTPIMSTTVLAAVLALPAFTLLGHIMGIDAVAAACYGVFASLTMLRYVGRAWSYSAERPWHVATSDLSYAFVSLSVLAVAVNLGQIAPDRSVYIALAGGTTAAVLGLGRGYASKLFSARGAALSHYGETWREQSRWSLMSVVTTEAVANAHIYLLTAFIGAAAVAPIAAGALLVRPINVIQTALIDYERSQLARFIGRGEVAEVDRSISLMRLVLLFVWGVTVALGATVLALQPGLIFPATYDLSTVRLAAGLWAIVWLVIAVQVPANVLLQASAQFHSLARASLCASAVSVTGVLVAAALHQPLWTIAAIVPGWVVSTVMVQRTARDFRRQNYRQPVRAVT